ncbi:hypothetical protein V8F33_006547 [Rhypophila sp. PSN 637]
MPVHQAVHQAIHQLKAEPSIEVGAFNMKKSKCVQVHAVRRSSQEKDSRLLEPVEHVELSSFTKSTIAPTERFLPRRNKYHWLKPVEITIRGDNKSPKHENIRTCQVSVRDTARILVSNDDTADQGARDCRRRCRCISNGSLQPLASLTPRGHSSKAKTSFGTRCSSCCCAGLLNYWNLATWSSSAHLLKTFAAFEQNFMTVPGSVSGRVESSQSQNRQFPPWQLGRLMFDGWTRLRLTKKPHLQVNGSWRCPTHKRLELTSGITAVSTSWKEDIRWVGIWSSFSLMSFSQTPYTFLVMEFQESGCTFPDSDGGFYEVPHGQVYFRGTRIRPPMMLSRDPEKILDAGGSWRGHKPAPHPRSMADFVEPQGLAPLPSRTSGGTDLAAYGIHICQVAIHVDDSRQSGFNMV